MIPDPENMAALKPGDVTFTWSNTAWVDEEENTVVKCVFLERSGQDFAFIARAASTVHAELFAKQIGLFVQKYVNNRMGPQNERAAVKSFYVRTSTLLRM
jgi:hypothetical protein